MPFILDPRDTQSALTGPLREELTQPKTLPKTSPPLLDVLASASRETTLAGAGFARWVNRDPERGDTPPGFDPFEHIAGYEDFAGRFVNADTPAQVAGIKSRLDQSRADQDVLRRAGLGGFGTQLVMGLLDPSFLVAIAVPEIKLGQLARIGRAATEARRGVAAAGAYEAGMHGLQEDRSWLQSGINIGAGALLSGVIGSLGRHASAEEISKLRDAVQADVGAGNSTVGAARVRPDVTLQDQTLAAGGETLSKGLSKTPGLRTDLDIVINSDSLVARQVLEDLADITPLLQKNFKGIRTADSVESALRRKDAVLADLSDALATQYSAYTVRVARSERITFEEFGAEVSHAMRNDDMSAITEATPVARMLRQRIFDPDYEAAKGLGLLPDPQKIAQSQLDERVVSDFIGRETQRLFKDFISRGAPGLPSETQALIAQIKSRHTAALSELPLKIRAREINAALRRDVDQAVPGLMQVFLNRARAAAEGHIPTGAPAPGGVESAGTGGFAHAEKSAGSGFERGRGQPDAAGRTAAGGPPAAGWSEETRIRSSRTADPLTVYRGGAREVGEGHFASDALASKTGHPSSGLGVFFTTSKAQAAQWGEVHSAHLDIRKPRIIKAEDLPGFATTAEAADFSRNLRKLGFDGLVIKNKHLGAPDWIVAFEPQQVVHDYALVKGAGAKRVADAEPTAGASAAAGAEADPAVAELARILKEHDSGKILGSRVARETAPPVNARVVGAPSYFRRMYSRDAIRSLRDEWHSVLVQHFRKTSSASLPEIEAAVEDVTRQILGADIGQANALKPINVSRAGPLNDRVLDIPDAKIEKFLVNDPLRVAQAYVKDLGAQVELARRFGGDVEMKQAFQDVADQYDLLRQQARDAGKLQGKALSAELTRLTDQEKVVTEALLRVRNRVLGTAGRVSSDAGEGVRRAVNASRGWRNLVAAAKLGGTALTGGTMDTARIVAQYGFFPTMSKLTQLIASPAFRKLSHEQARRAGSAVEVALSRRAQVQAEGAITEGWTEQLANGVYKYSGLNHVTDFNRTLAATLLEDSVLRASSVVGAGKALSKYETARLASLGLGTDELKAIAREIAEHGGEVDGIRVSGSADWGDKTLAELYDAAILKESKIVVQQPGLADRVWWMDREVGKFFGQLKSFAISSPSRLLTPGLQLAGAGEYARFARFMGYMMIGGYLTHTFRQLAAGKLPETDPLKASAEAFQESGMMGLLPDVATPIGRRLGVLPESARFSDRNVLSVLGPSMGAVGDAYDLIYNRSADGSISASDLHLIRRMLPYQNLWWARRAINALEGEVAEGLDLRGATQQGFAERALETTPLLSTKQRGGTGTGAYVP